VQDTKRVCPKQDHDPVRPGCMIEISSQHRNAIARVVLICIAFSAVSIRCPASDFEKPMRLFWDMCFW
jgi:hypothetical protein